MKLKHHPEFPFSFYLCPPNAALSRACFNKVCLERNISIGDRTHYCSGQKVAVPVYFSCVLCRIKKAVENYYDGRRVPLGFRKREGERFISPCQDTEVNHMVGSASLLP
jgi:hypothetical protein